jgi:hypothetical protein
MEKYSHSHTAFNVRSHTLEAMHFGMVESWSTCFCSDSSKASTSISLASEASALCLFYYFLEKREKETVDPLW